MASGKLSPRQKMINLMYLVFIAMIAMQMSKEVLSAFGYMNEKLTDNNTLFTEKNKNTYENLKGKASEQPEKYAEIFQKAEKIKDLTLSFNIYLENLKTIFLKDVENPTDYESMDKTSTVDEYLFLGDRFTKEGQEFVDHVVNFSLFHIVDGVIINQKQAKSNTVEIKPTTLISILTSENQHIILPYEENNEIDNSNKKKVWGQ